MRSRGHQALRLAIAMLCYVLAILPMAYFIPFLGAFLVPRTIDSGPIRPNAVVVDLALLLAFTLAHSLLVRGRARRGLVLAVGEELERPVYSAIAGAQMILLMAAWRPLPELLWHVEQPAGRAALWALYGAGWALALAGAFTLGTARLYGLTPVWDRYRGRPPRPAALELTGPFRFVRHPLYTGTIVAFWAAPSMSVGRALLATVFTVYILIGRRLEERDLLAAHGGRYAAYRRAVGGFMPRPAPGAKERHGLPTSNARRARLSTDRGRGVR